MKGHLVHLWEYTRWANGVVADALGALPEVEPAALKLFSHLISTEATWLARARGILPGAEKADPQREVFWCDRSLAECRRDSTESIVAWLRFLDELGETDLKTPIDFETLDGDALRNSVKEIVTHVVNHGTYHRAQIAALLRRAGVDPPVTGYIFYTHANPK